MNFEDQVEFKKHYKVLCYFAWEMVKDNELAEDLVQDAFAYLFVYPDKYDFRYSFKTYLFTLVHNKCVDDYRKTSRQTLIGNWDYDPAAPLRESDPMYCLLLREQQKELQNRLLALKLEYRTAIYLVDLERLTYEEAAAIMRKNTMAFKVLLYRARKKLRQMYEKEELDCGKIAADSARG